MRPSKTKDHAARAAKIAADTEEYLRRGGKVREIPVGQQVAKPADPWDEAIGRDYDRAMERRGAIGGQAGGGQ